MFASSSDLDDDSRTWSPCSDFTRISVRQMLIWLRARLYVGSLLRCFHLTVTDCTRNVWRVPPMHTATSRPFIRLALGWWAFSLRISFELCKSWGAESQILMQETWISLIYFDIIILNFDPFSILFSSCKRSLPLRDSSLSQSWSWSHAVCPCSFAMLQLYAIPVVPHKAVAEVSRRGKL